MRLLLDTQAFLWFILDDDRLSNSARNLIEDGQNTVLLSPVSHWEIAIKASIHKLTLGEPFHLLIPREIQRNAVTILPITVEDSAQVVLLPFHHRDPFDRMLIAQAIVQQVPVVSADSVFDAYPVTRIW